MSKSYTYWQRLCPKRARPLLFLFMLFTRGKMVYVTVSIEPEKVLDFQELVALFLRGAV